MMTDSQEVMKWWLHPDWNPEKEERRGRSNAEGPSEHGVPAQTGEPKPWGEGRRAGTPYQHAEGLAIMVAKSYASLG